MPRAILPIANGFYESSSLPISAQECVNWYPNIVQAPALNQETLFACPGLALLVNTGDTEVCRGAHVLNGVPYFVNGGTLYRLESDFTATDLGEIEGTGRVSIADNGAQLCIQVPLGKGYIFTSDPDTLTEITDADFRTNGEPLYVVELDKYFIFITDDNKFIISAINDGLSYNALDFGSGEKVEGNLVGLLAFKGQLFLFGEYSAAAFQNRPSGADFPFVFTGLTLEKGLDSAFSVTASNDTFMYIGGAREESPAVWAFSGNTVQKVSTTAIDAMLQSEGVSNAFAWSYAQSGAYFVGFSLQTTSFVYDVITRRWHERKTRYVDGRGNTQITRYRVNAFVEAYGKIICGDGIDGRIGSLSLDTNREYEFKIPRSISTQPFQNNMESFFLPSLELTVESGTGTLTDDPLIGLEISRDAKTYNPARFRGLGKIGEYKRRLIWRRNGRIPRFAVLRFFTDADVKLSLIQLTAQIEAGS